MVGALEGLSWGFSPLAGGRRALSFFCVFILNLVTVYTI